MIYFGIQLVMAVHQLLRQKGVRFLHDHLFCKLVKYGGLVVWHQDFSYWTRSTPMQHLMAWIGLDDALQENGCLWYIPSSHRWGWLNKPILTAEIDGFKAFLNKKQICRLNNPKPLRTFVLNVFDDGTFLKSNEKLLVGILRIKSGNKMEGKFFPLLYPAKHSKF